MKKQKVQAKINLEALAGGAFAEKLNEALMQVAENIQNPNTEATTKHQITVNIKFKPNKTRQMVGTQIAVTTKLAATEAIDTQMVMGVNMRTGQIEIAEYDGQIRGQMDLSDFTDAAFVPNPVSLIPYRTFLEVPQPASDFVFRISEGRGGAPAFKLVAADGGLWKSQAVDNVKNYLVKALADVPDREKITIIA
ncbi:MAG: hypothetical protein ACLU9Q_08100 [Marvinbryantia sp.]|uniref:hypothetical protein n=1 Tax=Marvinbryantia sp. TaxID=2496532 RepID=UPI0039995233